MGIFLCQKCKNQNQNWIRKAPPNCMKWQRMFENYFLTTATPQPAAGKIISCWNKVFTVPTLFQHVVIFFL